MAISTPARRPASVCAPALGARPIGDQDVQVVGVLHGPGAEHGVGVDHGVGLGPGDLLATGRWTVEQVGGAGVRRSHPEPEVCIGHGLGRLAELRGNAVLPPAAAVDAEGVMLVGTATWPPSSTSRSAKRRLAGP